MKVYITLDYELFFGADSGTAAKCVLEPTERLLEIAFSHGVHFNFFVDGGYLLALEKYSKRYPSVAYEKQQVFAQIRKLSAAGHDCQLHIHPHWEDSYYDGNGWKMNTERYRLNQFSAEQIKEIVTSYFNITADVSGKAPIAYRAGGWCLPDWHLVSEVFKGLGVWIDSTVYAEGYVKEGVFDYDFRNAPDLDQWFFEKNPLKQEDEGSFAELPITSLEVSPLFFWNLYVKGRFNRSLHKAMGDGIPSPQKSARNKVLSGYTRQALSCDGYHAGMLSTYIHKQQHSKETIVIIGHPKAQSIYSLQKLDECIGAVKSICTFARYSDLQHSGSGFIK